MKTTDEPSAINLAIAAELRAARARKGISRDELADRSGVSRSSIFLFERGERGLRIDQLFAITEVLDVTPAAIAQAAQDALSEQG